MVDNPVVKVGLEVELLETARDGYWSEEHVQALVQDKVRSLEKLDGIAFIRPSKVVRGAERIERPSYEPCTEDKIRNWLGTACVSSGVEKISELTNIKDPRMGDVVRAYHLGCRDALVRLLRESDLATLQDARKQMAREDRFERLLH